MDAKISQHIFSPFFTCEKFVTKVLSVVKSIMTPYFSIEK